MREILFRAKTARDSEWIYGDLLHDGYDYDVAIWEEKTKLVTEIQPQTVGQYTGLTDKKGKKIFEGDVLKDSDIVVGGEVQIKGQVFEVAMRKGVWCVQEKDDWDFLNTYAQRCEVIGNIHDNPELLGGADNGKAV